MRFFFDHNLSPKLADGFHALSQPNHEVVHLSRKFAPEITDAEWIKQLSKEKDWVVVSRDKLKKRGKKGPPEREVVRLSGLTAFLLSADWSAPYWEQVWRLARWWPELIRTAETVTRGVGYMVPKNPPTQKTGKLIPLWT